MTTQPLPWLKQISSELYLAKKIPLWGEPPPFPWEELSTQLQNLLQAPDLRIFPQTVQMLHPDEFLSSFGETPFISSLELIPLPGVLHWIVSSESIHTITSLLLSSEMNVKGPTDPNLVEGFYQYLLLQVMSCLDKINTYHLQMQWLDNKPLPKTSSFACDVTIHLQQQLFPARLLIPSEFNEAFSSHFPSKKPSLQTSPFLDQLSVAVHLEAGSCSLSQDEWKTIKLGDFIVLDRCSYDPSTQKGILTLTLGSSSLFKIKIKKNKLKILDYYINGDQTIMEEDIDLEPFDKEPEKEELTSEEPLWEEDEKQEVAAQMAESLTPPQDILFPVVVEVAQIQMNLQKLLQLQPGNVLDLSVHPEDGIYLTIHGKKIAKGELIKLGDTLGVKIVELGDKSPS